MLIGSVMLAVLGHASWLSVYRVEIPRLAERGRPLVEAIKRFEADYGVAPKGLGDLVPKYLPNGVPDTGQGAAKPFRYDPPVPAKGIPWRISAPTPMPVMSFDGLYYTPTGDYKWLENSGWVERFADWGYLHE